MEIKRKLNKGVIFGKRENNLHLITKILLAKKLLERGRKKVQTEVKVKNMEGQTRFADVVDDDSRLAYEIEKKPTKKYKADTEKFYKDMEALVLIIDLSKMPKSIHEGIKELDKWLEELII